MARVIDTFEDALAYLQEFQQQEGGGAPDPVFMGEMESIRITIDGPRYKGTVPGELARGLWEFQEAVYRAAAYALYNAEDIRRLTAKDRKDFELVFEVEEGSTELLAKIPEMLTALKEGWVNMESKHKAYTMVAIAALLVSGYVAVSLADQYGSLKKDELQKNTTIELEKQKTEQFKILGRVASTDPVAGAFARAAEEGTRSIINNVADATSIQVGRVELDKEEMDSIRARAPKEKSVGQVVTEPFRVLATISRDPSFTRYVLQRVSDGSEVTVLVSHEDTSPDALEKLWEAARTRKPITLEMNLTINKGTLRSALLISAPATS